jgi:cell fate regulator YaaT (PSP1 superfamily)
MARIIEVSFKANRREYFTSESDELAVRDHVLVEADRGEDLGLVTANGAVAERKCSGCSTGCAAPVPVRRVLRNARPEEIERARAQREDEPRVRQIAREKVIQFGLKMKVSEAEWQFDRNKLTIFFTAERRVDFRELVRELARTFRTRIELKQIGVRDEAALLGGVGRCGRELCCSTWLRELKPVSLQLAKDQRLSLNPAQISGCCGRLMCCLTYEHDSYVQARKKFPREGKTVVTAHGREKVISVDIWRERLQLKDEEGNRRTVSLVDLRAEVAAGGGEPERGEPPEGAERGERGERGDAGLRERERGQGPRPPRSRGGEERGHRGEGNGSGNGGPREEGPSGSNGATGNGHG